jgi:beta-lactam-binding protein with PASTA domain
MLKEVLYRVSLYGLIFLIIFFLAAVVLARFILRSETVTVPDLTGKTVAEAQAELTKKDLSLTSAGSEFNDEWDKGKIIRQDPGPGSRIQVTKHVRAILSAGSERAEVPSLEGKMQEAVMPLLREAGLARGPLAQIHTGQYAAGKVINQFPTPGTLVERGTPVALLVSQGQAEERYLMPDLIGHKAARIVQRLQALDFKVSDIRYVYYPGLEAGLIVKQSPPGGFRIQKSYPITLEVSRT